eukprot:TRINITY_DN29925_c0_g1_i1.p1 TRINITY_DN29925_c0_g1~~TRINITY_DN29925_c0_g1_i1.p1  ORF type:complete len:392 (+),score=97.61 TRINITY_DN29925_c0_g1_i1:53-1228(+)
MPTTHTYQTGQHSYTEVKHTGYGERVGNSFCNAVFGVVLVPLTCALIFWNETNAVASAQELAWLRHETEVLGSATAPPDLAALAGRPVHMTGPVVGEPLTDATQTYRLTLDAAVLKRRVEMFQWQERSRTKSEKNLGGSTTQTKHVHYETSWSSSHHSSAHFKLPGHENPPMMPDTSLTASSVTLGWARLGNDVINALPTATVLVNRGMFGAADEYGAILNGGQVYMGYNANSPAVGDLRISYQAYESGELATVVGVIHEDGVITGAKGSVLPLVVRGHQSVHEVISSAETTNTIQCWGIRAISIIVMYFAILMCASPISTLADVVPFLGWLTGFVTGWLALIPALGISLSVMAFAWMWARPMLSFGMLVAVILLFIFANPKKAPERPKSA